MLCNTGCFTAKVAASVEAYVKCYQMATCVHSRETYVSGCLGFSST